MGGRRGMGVTGRHLMKTVTPSPGVAWRATARAPRRRPLLGRPDSESESDPPGPGCRVRRQWPRAGGGRPAEELGPASTRITETAGGRWRRSGGRPAIPAGGPQRRSGAGPAVTKFN